MKRADWILIVCITVFAIGIWLWSAMDRNSKMEETGRQVVVTIDGEIYRRLALSEDICLDIPTKDGNSLLVISQGACYMEFAHCPDQICVKHKPIQVTGESIICLPYKIVVSIEGSGEAEYDN